jgi:hypothetical protein
MTRDRFIRFGFIAGGLSNIGGVLLCTQGFTSSVVAQHFPEVFSHFGMLAIMLWGLAYIAVSRSYAAVPWLAAVFALEKAAYVCTWLLWIRTNHLGPVFDQSFTAGLFYAVYGANDLAFGLFFAWVFWISRGTKAGAHA